MGVDSKVATHDLNVDLDPTTRPKRQKEWTQALEKQEATSKEVDRLLNIKCIQEVHYPEWLANVVLVQKSSKKWRMCVDFTDLNKCCPNDSFPLPSIDQLVDGASGNKLLSMMDIFLGYNQI